MELITGASTIYAMLGHPIAQVQSPGLFNHYFQLAGVDAVMASFDISPAGIDDFFTFLRHCHNCPGCVITVPHKQAAFRHADKLSAQAERIGACNLIRRLPSGELEGDMVDGQGYLNALAQKSISVAQRHMILIGAGGVGSAIAHAVASAGAASIALLEIDPERRQNLVQSLRKYYPDLSVYDNHGGPVKADIIANASPLGMNPDDPLPYPLADIADNTIVTDVITSPGLSSWLQIAQAQNCRIQTGREMAQAQFAIFSRFFGYQPSEAELSHILSVANQS